MAVDHNTVFDSVLIAFSFDGEGNSIHSAVFDGTAWVANVARGGGLLAELDTSVAEVIRRVRAGTASLRYQIQWDTGQPTLHTETLPDHLEFIDDLHLFHLEEAPTQTIVGIQRVLLALWRRYEPTNVKAVPDEPEATWSDDGFEVTELGVWKEDAADATGEDTLWIALSTARNDGEGWTQEAWEIFPVEIPIQWSNDPNSDTGSEEEADQDFFRFWTGDGWSGWIPRGGRLGDSLTWTRVAYGHLSFRRGEHAEWGVSPYVNLDGYKEMRFVAKRFEDWDTWDSEWAQYGEVVLSMQAIGLSSPPANNVSRYEIDGVTLYCHFSDELAHVVQSIRSTHGGTPGTDVRFQITPYRPTQTNDRRLGGFFVQDLEDSEWSMMRIEISVR